MTGYANSPLWGGRQREADAVIGKAATILPSSLEGGMLDVGYFVTWTMFMFYLSSDVITSCSYSCLDPSWSQDGLVWCWCSVKPSAFHRRTPKDLAAPGQLTATQGPADGASAARGCQGLLLPMQQLARDHTGPELNLSQIQTANTTPHWDFFLKLITEKHDEGKRLKKKKKSWSQTIKASQIRTFSS